jgi:hypothetical protein
MKMSAAFVLCVLLSGCVDLKPLADGEPDQAIPHAMLDSIQANPPVPQANPLVPAAAGSACYKLVGPDGKTTTGSPTAKECFWTFKSAIDANYQHYKTSLVHADDVGNLTADLVALGLTTAGAITPGAAGPRLFSALATGVLGVKSYVNEDVLFKQTVTMITNEMDSDRADAYAKIAPHLQLSPYPYAEVVDDMLVYYEAGTFQHAMGSLQAKAGLTGSSTSSTPYAAQVKVTLSYPKGAAAFTPPETFILSATIAGKSVLEAYSTVPADTLATAATNLASKFKSTAITATPGSGDGTMTLSYTTSDVVSWLADPSDGTIQVGSQTTVPATATK